MVCTYFMLLFIPIFFNLTGHAENWRNSNCAKKVLSHYANNPQKLLAAEYLLSNMQYNYTINGLIFSKYSPFFEFLDSLNRIGTNKIQKSKKGTMGQVIKQKWMMTQSRIFEQDYANLYKVQDQYAVTSSDIIQNIDNSFIAWEQYPWSKQVSFTDFCEYILPYRLFHEQLGDWRAYFSLRYKPLMTHFSNTTNPVKVADSINKELETWFGFNEIFYQYPFDMGLSQLLQSHIGGCKHMTTLATYALRSMGVPCAVDYAPCYGNRSLGHTWNVVFNQRMEAIPFNAASTEWLEMGYVFHKQTLDVKLPKVYRQMFSAQASSLAMQRKDNEEIPQLFSDPTCRDVTSEYVDVATVRIPIPAPLQDGTLVYLCVFDNQNWVPVAWSRSTGGAASFTDVGCDIVYLPSIFQNHTIVPISDPIQLHANGNSKTLRSLKGRAQSVLLFDKYPPSLTSQNDTTNSILPGDIYELFCWENNKWCSLGVKTTNDRKADIDSLGPDFKKTQFFGNIGDKEYLFYENIPVGSLFLLKNHSRGREERIFTIENSQQIWW